MERRGETLRRLAVSLFLGANLVSLLALAFCCASTWISPALHPRLGAVGLVFPFLLFFNVLFLPFWLVFKPRLTLLPLVGLLLCGGFILDYIPLWGGRGEGQPTLTVMTWNIKNLDSHLPAEQEEPLMDSIAALNLDVLCIQECLGGRMVFRLYDVMDSLGFHREAFQGRVTFSRFPILSVDTLDAPTSGSNGGLLCRLLVGEDTLSVLNVHLESNFISRKDRANSRQAIESGEPERLEREGLHIWHKLAQAAVYRARQTDSIAALLDRLPPGQAVIVCGDFNDTPISYTYQQVNSRLDNAFRQCGRGVGVTYSDKWFPVRIDHLFHSTHWKALSAEVGRHMPGSDHYPLVTRLRKRENH